MSVFGSNILTKLTTELFGFGVTLNPDGSVASITGATMEYVTAAPTATRNGGSLALRSDGTLYGTAGAGVWFAIGGGGGTGWNLPDNVIGIWGTTAPKQVDSVYLSASNRFDLVGADNSSATAVTNPDMRIGTGANTITGAVAGSPSGFLQIRTGATDCTNAGGTGGATGDLSLTTGNATSTLGVSGSTGAITVVTGNSDDANSGSITLQTGTAAGTRGSVMFNTAIVSSVTQAQQWLAIDNTAAAYQWGATGALNMLTMDTTNAAERFVVAAVAGMQAVDDVAFSVATNANDRFAFSYVSGSTTGSIAGVAITAGGATQATRPFSIATGARSLTDAAGSPASGALSLVTGSTNVAFGAGGATGGVSGDISIATGASTVSLGANTGGSTGAVAISTGSASAAAGTAGGSGAITIGSGTTSSGPSSGSVTVSTGNVTSGVGNSGSINLTPGTSAGGTRGQVVATGLRTSSANATAISSARTVLLADSGGVFSVSQAAAYAITLPSPTVGAGLKYEFFLGTAAANSVTIVVSGGAATFIGTIVNDVTSVLPATGSTLTFVTGTAALGDNIQIYSLATNLYAVRAVSSTAGGITIT